MNREFEDIIEKEFKFLKIENRPLKLFVSEKLFIPNKTTQTIAEAVEVYADETGIELGAGTGPLTVLIASKPIAHLYSVERVKEQYDLAKKNVEKYNLSNKVTLYEGNIFDPIKENHVGGFFASFKPTTEPRRRNSSWVQFEAIKSSRNVSKTRV